MAIKELDPGERHTMGLNPWRVRLTGTTTDAVLRAVDQAGHDSSLTSRLTATELVVIPEPRRLRLTVEPSSGGPFAPGTSIGVSLVAEGTGGSDDQILVSSVDVGALPSYELATLEFATNRTVVAVPVPRIVERHEDQSRTVVARLPLDTVDDTAHPWVQTGRYALRDAEQRGPLAEPPDGWSLVIDGSASMLSLYGTGALESVVRLASGVMIQWTGRWASASVAAGVHRISIPGASSDPSTLLSAAFEGPEPASGVDLASALEDAAASLPSAGGVLVVTDGVPGDVERIAETIKASPTRRVFVLVVGRSRFGLPSERIGVDWWRDELLGLSSLAELPNVEVVAVRPESAAALMDGGDRASELAAALAARVGVSA